MKTLALSGWGQPHDALAAVLPDATHAEYAHNTSLQAALEDIGKQAAGHDLVVGWSLGGQLAVRAIAAGLIKPKKLVLIAAPFQFVEVGKNGIGMKEDTFEKFFSNYARDPLRTLHKAWELIALDDDHADMIKRTLNTFSKDAVLAKNWLNWLSLVHGVSCEHLDFRNFPSTLIVQGDKDVVVEMAQSQRFAGRIADSRLIIWQGCGHAPHWHDTKKLTQLIGEHAGV